MSVSEAMVVDGEASESEEESTDEVLTPTKRSNLEEARKSIASLSLSSVTAQVGKQIGAFSGMDISKAARRSPPSGEDKWKEPVQHQSLLHKKLYEKNALIQTNTKSFFENLFSRNFNELNKINTEIAFTQVHMQESTLAMQHSVHNCNQLEESFKKVHETLARTKLPK
eukprot:TRINITY_DN47089_c0_g1_i1.p1 TRINITY_DN47089_c0_g1~~TRINITY_DN47089_c0_g1_i1.p1  ORF type:complete len:183 (-),score=43.78 TRINITY_DN47089_c0_g1_i1:108-614(-)